MPDKKSSRKRVAKFEEISITLSKLQLMELEELAALNCTYHEAACWFDVSDETMDALLKVPNIRETWRRGKGMGKIRLRRKQFELAEKNASISTMLGRQLLGQKDPSDSSVGGTVTVLVDTGIDRGNDAKD